MKVKSDKYLNNVVRLLKNIPETFGEDKNPFVLTIKSNITTLEKEESELRDSIQDIIRKHALTDENGEIVKKEGVESISVISDIEYSDEEAFIKELDEFLVKEYDKDIELKTIDPTKIYLHRSGEKITYENFITNSLTGEKLLIDYHKVQSGTELDGDGNEVPTYKEVPVEISIIDFLVEIGMIKQ